MFTTNCDIGGGREKYRDVTFDVRFGFCVVFVAVLCRLLELVCGSGVEVCDVILEVSSENFDDDRRGELF